MAKIGTAITEIDVTLTENFCRIVKQAQYVQALDKNIPYKIINICLYSIDPKLFKSKYNANLCSLFESKINENQFWDIPTIIDEDKGIKFYTSELDRLLEESVKKQIVSDVPVGAFISGGLDSSLLLSYLKNYKPDINTYISGFNVEGYDEFKYADIVANHLSLSDPNKIQIDQTEYINKLKHSVEFREI